VRKLAEAGKSKQKPKDDGKHPDKCSEAGRTPHTHELRWDENRLTSHGPASAGEPHNHEIVHKADGSWFLAHALDDTDDPEHTHDVNPEINQAESRTRAGRILAALAENLEVEIRRHEQKLKAMFDPSLPSDLHWPGTADELRKKIQDLKAKAKKS
jgi:hypothetical protein